MLTRVVLPLPRNAPTTKTSRTLRIAVGARKLAWLALNGMRLVADRRWIERRLGALRFSLATTATTPAGSSALNRLFVANIYVSSVPCDRGSAGCRDCPLPDMPCLGPYAVCVVYGGAEAAPVPRSYEGR